MARHIMLFDPVPCKGGSKKVAQSVFSLCPKNVLITVVSNDMASWRNMTIRFLPLLKWRWLINQAHGLGYLLKHIILCLTMVFYIFRFGRPRKLLGISGPTVDFTIYIIGWLFRIDVVQLIQGNTSSSSIAKYCLNRAIAVYYLKSTENSIKKALLLPKNTSLCLASKFHRFINSVDAKQISSRKETDSVGVLWAASLQRWKRVDTFVNAFEKLQQSSVKQTMRYHGNICFLGNLCNHLVEKVSEIDALTLYQDPDNLDQIRSQSAIFVSTSVEEPFGLAILESMLAGLVIVIPSDNAYWDQQLTHGVNCIKYAPNNSDNLYKVLEELINDQELRNTLTNQSQKIAQYYTGTDNYQGIVNCLNY
jgi:glycosyltransferase involved in cell wall biosynthesis